MRSTLSFLWSVLVGIVFAGANVSAVDYPGWRLLPLPIGGGLNVSLTTSGYCFHQLPDQGEAAVINEKILPPDSGVRTSFTACVSLANRSRSPIPFTFNDAGPRWTFRIVDSEDHELWRSDSDIVSAQVLTNDKLGAGKTWKQTARIPLFVDGTPLPVGVYTLQAFLNADKAVSATSAFEVVADPWLTTGIKGLVLKQIAPPDGTYGPITEVPAAGLLVRVTEILDPLALVKRLPFIWIGYTNSEGRFTVNTPPGRFQVTAYERAYWPGPYLDNVRIGLPTIPVATAEVTVQRGAFSEVTLSYKPKTPPPITQGISGSVSIVWYVANTADGQSGEVIRLIPSFSVQITQIDVPEGTTPFKWNGFTDSEGKFQVATPPGRFQIDATGGFIPLATTSLIPAVLPPHGSTTVTVEPNMVTTANVLVYGGWWGPVVPLDPVASNNQ
jgi:hypothetical protein